MQRTEEQVDNDLKHDYPLIPMGAITYEARRLAVAWVEGYERQGMDVPGKQKLASDIMNYARRHQNQDFTEAVIKWMAWTKETFPKSGAKASLIHLLEEVKEIIAELDSEFPTPTSEEGVALMEYADAFICLLTSAGKSGFTLDDLLRATKNKMEINYKREWKLNPDNTYSHIK